jgi:hypothetical protein
VGNSYINLPMRAWYQRTVDAQPGQPQAFTTVLMPHAPGMDAAELAGAITLLRDEPGLTVLQVKGADATRTLLLNSSGKPVTIGKLTTDAEAALLTPGKTTHVELWQATAAKYGSQTLVKAKTPVHAQRDVK